MSIYILNKKCVYYSKLHALNMRTPRYGVGDLIVDQLQGGVETPPFRW